MSAKVPSPAPPKKPKPVPERFQVAKTTLWFDRIMTKTIIGGGFTVIVAVFGILFFLLAVTIPLFQGADVEERQHLAPPLSREPGAWTLPARSPSSMTTAKTSSFWTRQPGT